MIPLEVTQTKVCFKCGQEKALDEFYRHSKMGDGRLNKCKDCTRKDVTENRWKNVERIREYDRQRGKLPHRIERNTARTREYRKNNPEKYKAHRVVSNAKRDGKISSDNVCAVCGTTERLEAHHHDYSKPLDVTWLCSVHHTAVHMAMGCALL